ncbi:protein-disulfide reductase DsbD domain-containing protein [Hoeflea sp. CAU 1731]
MSVIVVFFLAAITIPVVGHTASSEWAETEGGRVRLTALPPSEDGVIRAILDVDLLPGWKTYWRDPGDAGIPPQLDFAKSANVEAAEVKFPAPARIDDGYAVWAGYTYPVAFPIRLDQEEAGIQSVIDVNVFMGICEKICIPVQAEFSVTVAPQDAATDYEKHLVETAFRQLPARPHDGFHIDGVTLGDNSKSVSFNVHAPEGEIEIFVTGPQGWAFDVPQAQASKDGYTTFEALVLDAPQDATLSATGITILAKAGRQSIETEISMP